MRMTTRRLLGAAALVALTTGLLGGTASAGPGKDKPVPPAGDDRAVSHSGNLEWNHTDACATAGLKGKAFDDGGTPTLASTTDGTHLTITGGIEGYTVTGVVVKGGNAYNVYPAAKLGELAWEDLHAPEHDNNGTAGIPEISHWFFCAEKSTTPDKPVEENPNPDETTPEETTPQETESVTPSSSNTAAPTTASSAAPSAAPSTEVTTTTPAAVASSGANDLADTGFDGGWMLVVGLGLVALGAAFVASPKLRGLLRR